MHDLSTILSLSAAQHKHLCPRQVLGARIGLAGAAALGLEAPRADKRLLIFVETDGCFADGIAAATGCTLGHRTLRLADYGKIAATCVDVKMETAVRVAPQLDIRAKAYHYAPDEKKHYYAQLLGYQAMPDAELLTIRPVRLSTPVRQIVSRTGVRVNCAACGEEIINERETVRDGRPYCRACLDLAYYRPLTDTAFVAKIEEAGDNKYQAAPGDTMSEIPRAHNNFMAEFPAVAQAYAQLGEAVHAAGPLDEQARQLVKLALAIGARHEGAVHAHTRRALAVGLTPEALKQVAALAVTTLGMPNAVAAYTWVNDILSAAQEA